MVALKKKLNEFISSFSVRNSVFNNIRFLIVIALFLNGTNLKAQRDIIISTDCAIDDLRALCEFMAVPEINVRAIISADGMLPPDKGKTKILEFLNQLNIKNIPVGEGRKISKEESQHAAFLQTVKWGTELQVNPKSISAEELFKKLLSESENPITIICLGPLTDISDFVKKYPEQKKKIKNIIWYNEAVSPLSGTNYEFNKKAAESLFAEHITIDVISNQSDPQAALSKTYFDKVGELKTPFAELLTKAHNTESIKTAITKGYFKLWDDLIPVYCLYPELFDMETMMGNPSINFSKKISFEAVHEKLIQILSQTYSLERNIIFDRFPSDTAAYKYDVREIMNEAIKKYGAEEWRICVLTSEIHQHLGTYSIVGAKMGMLARDIFKTDIDRIEIISFAGNQPPLSCMNDGLQISTGATLGLGMISIANDSVSSPSAIFTYKGKKIKITLKKEISQRIKEDIDNGIVKVGGFTDGYWKLIRAMSVKHWLELDRNNIFEIEELK